MRVRFKFDADLVIEGQSMKEIKHKFMSMPLFSKEAVNNHSLEFGEVFLVEDAETYDDLMSEYNGC